MEDSNLEKKTITYMSTKTCLHLLRIIQKQGTNGSSKDTDKRETYVQTTVLVR